jgi:hypothetical protein
VDQDRHNYLVEADEEDNAVAVVVVAGQDAVVERMTAMEADQAVLVVVLDLDALEADLVVVLVASFLDQDAAAVDREVLKDPVAEELVEVPAAVAVVGGELVVDPYSFFIIGKE